MAGDGARTHELQLLQQQVAALSQALAAAAVREAELIESEARFRILAEESLACVYVIQDRKLAYVNQAGADLFGAPRDQIVGAPIEPHLTPESRPIVAENIGRRLAGEIQTMPYRVQLVTRDGTVRDCEVLGTVAQWAGRPAIVGTAIDRTDELHQHARLEEQTRLLHLILDSMGDGVAVTDATGDFFIFNPAARRITGMGPAGSTPEEWTQVYGILGSDGVTPVAPSDVPLARALKGESTNGVELFLRHPETGAGTWINVTGRPLVDERGTSHGGVVVFRDTTEHRNMFDQLQRAETQYRTLVEQLPVMVYSADPAAPGTVYYVSPQVEAILGFTPREWIEDVGLWQRQLHPEDRDRVVAEVIRSSESGERFICEYRIHARDGRIVWLHDEAVILEDGPHGRPVIQGVLLDVSEREEERSGRMRLQAWSSDLVTVQEQERRRIGLELHDGIGQVLTGLRMHLAALRAGPEPVPQDGLLAVESLVDDAIEAVRALSQSLRPAVLDDLGLLPALVSHVEHWQRQTRIQVELEHRGIERRRFPPAAETAAYRVVQEALTNVARHADTATAKVRVVADASTLRVEIEDPGIGFDAESLSRDQSMHGIGGMRERVGILGGSLTVESLLGCGCRLLAEIPLHTSEPATEVSV